MRAACGIIEEVALIVGAGLLVVLLAVGAVAITIARYHVGL